jgi:hypothetical protein
MEDGSKTVWDDYEDLRNHWMMMDGRNMRHVVVQVKATSQTGTRKRPSGF